MAKLFAIFALALTIASLAEANYNGNINLRDVRTRLMTGSRPGGYGSSMASAAASAYGQGSSAAASAAAASSGRKYAQQPSYRQPYQQPASAPMYGNPYQQPPRPVVQRPVVAPRYGGSANAAAATAAGVGGGYNSNWAGSAANAYTSGSGAASSSAAAAASSRYAPQPQQYTPSAALPSYQSAPSRMPRPMPDFGSKYAAAVAAAQAHNTDDDDNSFPAPAPASAPLRPAPQPVFGGQPKPVPARFPQGQHYSAQAGAFANAGRGPTSESSHYKKAASEEIEHEDGSLDDNHYRKANSFGKSEDERLKVSSGQDDHDLDVTADRYSSRKRRNHYNLDYSKSATQSGSSMEAHDHHKQAYNRDSRKMHELIDQSQTKMSDGTVETSGLASKKYVDDGDVEFYDSDGLNSGLQQNAGGAVAASSAAAAGRGATSASAATAVGGH